jgi:D-glycero-D-manno-heptose 1,7-bisphosphate phosphatase
MVQKAIFLDRDGVINVDTGYVHRISNFKFLEGIFELTRAAVAKDYLVFVVTNQAGIGRGYYSEEDFQILTKWMLDRFKSEGVEIKKVFFSPYHPVHGIGEYKKDHVSRKPHPGMLLEAKSEFDLELGACILIGDKASDVRAGISAGVGTNLYLSNDVYGDNLGLENYHRISCIAQAKNYL